MIPRPRTILIGLLVVQVMGYLLFAEVSLERKACDKYMQFTERRFANKWNKNVSESIVVSSCGDQYFRNLSRLKDAARSSNPEHSPAEIHLFDSYGMDDFVQYVSAEDYHDNPVETFRKHTDSTQTTNCIVFKICTTRTFPVLCKQIQYDYAYSYGSSDLHAMLYNNFFETADATYIWLLFTWIEVHGPIFNAMDRKH